LSKSSYIFDVLWWMYHKLCRQSRFFWWYPGGKYKVLIVSHPYFTQYSYFLNAVSLKFESLMLMSPILICPFRHSCNTSSKSVFANEHITGLEWVTREMVQCCDRRFGTWLTEAMRSSVYPFLTVDHRSEDRKKVGVIAGYVPTPFFRKLRSYHPQKMNRLARTCIQSCRFQAMVENVKSWPRFVDCRVSALRFIVK
jgi:hypothetical protein